MAGGSQGDSVPAVGAAAPDASSAVRAGGELGRAGRRIPGGAWGALLAWSPIVAVAAAAACAAALAAFPETFFGFRPSPDEDEFRLRCDNPDCGAVTYWFAMTEGAPPRVCPECGSGRLRYPMECRRCGRLFDSPAPESAVCPDCGSAEVCIHDLTRRLGVKGFPERLLADPPRR